MHIAIGIGVSLATGLVDYSFLHNNAGGQWLISKTDPFFQAFFDATGMSHWGSSEAATEALKGHASMGVNPDGSLNFMPT
jgi:hypothetical protein